LLRFFIRGPSTLWLYIHHLTILISCNQSDNQHLWIRTTECQLVAGQLKHFIGTNKDYNYMLKLLNPFSQCMINGRWQILKLSGFYPVFLKPPVNGNCCVGRFSLYGKAFHLSVGPTLSQLNYYLIIQRHPLHLN